MPNELLPTNIQFGTVVGRFGSAPLIAGDVDGLPDFSPATGLTVTFTPSTAAVIDATASPAPVTIEMVPIVCGLDTQGYLVGGDGQRGVKLIATNDTDINPSGWTYSVTFLRGGAKVAAFRDFSMSLPAGVTKDIALTIPVPSSEGVSLSQAQAAEAAAVSAASQASAAAAAAAASAATFVPATVDTLGQASTTGKAIAKAADADAARTAIGVEKTVVLGSNGATNVTLINNAMTSLSASGKANGTLILRGQSAPIASTVTLNLGYPNINSTVAYSGERFTLKVDGSLTFASGIGVGLLIKSGYNAVIDVKVQGGGSASDVAVQVEDHQCLDLSVVGAGFAGTLLKADAFGDTSKRIRTSHVRKVAATNCGQAIYWRNIEAFGQFGHIWDNNCVNGSQFINCADTAIAFFENYSPATQTIGLDFDNCGAFQVGVISLGDSAATLMRIRGGDFGRINQVRVSGSPSTPGLINGILLEDVASVDIDNVTTFRCAVGLEVRGTQSTGGIHVKQHRSVTSDVVPLLVSAGTTGVPTVAVRADYRNTRESIKIGPGVTGGSLTLSGIVRDMHLNGASGKYVIDVDATSGALLMDVTGLRQNARGGGLTGFTNHPTPANVYGVPAASIGDIVTHGVAPAATGMVLGTAWRNPTARTVAVIVAVKLNPGVGTNAGVNWRLGPTSSPPTVVDALITGDATLDLPENRIVTTFIVPPYWYLIGTASTGTGTTLATSNYYAIS